jgi:hypothetical protein
MVETELAPFDVKSSRYSFFSTEQAPFLPSFSQSAEVETINQILIHAFKLGR